MRRGRRKRIEVVIGSMVTGDGGCRGESRTGVVLSATGTSGLEGRLLLAEDVATGIKGTQRLNYKLPLAESIMVSLEVNFA